MKIKASNIIILSIFFSITAIAKDPKFPEPEVHTVTYVKEYFKDSHGYNMTKPCTGEKCIPSGSTVGCSSYDYFKHKKMSNTKLQVCNISSIKNEALGIDKNLTNQDYTVVTGIIKDGQISDVLPYGELYMATRFRLLDYKPKEALPQPLPEVEETVETELGTVDLQKAELPATTEGGSCADGACEATAVDPCKTPGPLNSVLCITDSAKKLIFNENPFDAYLDKQKIAESFKRAKFSQNCHGFIKADGELGEWGKQAVKTFKSVCPECFFGEKPFNMGKVCPNFSKFSQAQKEHFVGGWIMASIGMHESTCRTNVRVKGTRVRTKSGKIHQEMAVGMFQMEESYYRRKGRASECESSKGESLYSMNFQLRCTASLMRDLRYQKGDNTLWGSGDQYWQELRRINGQGGKITQSIGKFPGCH